MLSNYTKNFIIISFISILVSRLLPLPPNFTSTIAIAFYIPALFGYRFIAVALAAFILSDLILGLHNLLLFTWGSLLFISLFSKFFKNYYYRIGGVILSCLIFYLVSNFGVWLFSEIYTHDIEGITLCYLMALPFFQNSIVSSLIISVVVEILLSISFFKNLVVKVNPSY